MGNVATLGTSDSLHQSIVEQCEGCGRINASGDNNYCAVFINPVIKWRVGNCTLATHIKVELQTDLARSRVGQQKQKKR